MLNLDRMVNIFFIHRFTFTKDAFIRDEFEYFNQRGYNVKYLDIAHLLKKRKLESACPPELKHYLIAFSTKGEFDTFIQKHKATSVIVTDVGLLANSAWMYVTLSRAKIPFILFENAVFPRIKTKEIFKSGKLGFIKFFRRLSLKKILMKPMDLYMLLRVTLSRAHARMIIASRDSLSSEHRSLRGADTSIKYTVSLDYQIAQNIKSDCLVNADYAVFIDQYFIHHPDFKTNHIIYNFTADEYYGEVNAFLKAFSISTGLKVVIAAHPRRNMEGFEDFLPEFELYYNCTAELIKGARIVLIHFSTAINFAIIFQKPFLLLNSRLFNSSNINSEIEKFAQYFKVQALIMTDEFANPSFNSSAIYDVDIDKYRAFMTSFIKHPKSGVYSFRDLIESEVLKIMGSKQGSDSTGDQV